MNYKAILNILGTLLIIVAAAMILPVLVGLYYREKDIFAFIITSGITYLSGKLLKKCTYEGKGLQYKDGFVVVTLGWFLVSIYGALPFLISGVFKNPIDAFFESVSGFTTTGATVIMSLESVSKTVLFWRSLTHWLGGMGIIVMTMAILPELAGNMHLFKAEVPGPLHNRIQPRIQDTAKTLWLLYFFITICEIILLWISGVPFFESIIHSFGTVSTGGFSSRALSVKAYNSLLVDTIVTFFMFVAGTNFNLIYDLFRGKIRTFIKDEEFRFYIWILLIAIFLVSINLIFNVYDNPNDAIRYASFQVVSISSTTGYATVDYDTWPPFSRWILLILMFIGGSAGSTAGGIKVIRIKVLFKKGLQELYYLLHPRAIKKIKINKMVVSERVSTSILGFFFLYIMVFVMVTVVLTYFGIDLISAISAVAATLGNIGPGLELVGPLNSYLPFPDSAKLLLSFCMMLGRLEIYTILVFMFMDWR
ncbi:TrkH family potassium uptake protein [Halothermothrix orenii]|uniref:Cation transporter n=1 Tax=Halothermothrix orenii (strain H 168 / OCM 544 / DSM 9562) TaxID=373903 RepID=B8CWZ7_HALOH|nr:potassium transporter TrkG [Halothermothrix orenii]ACL69816.1 cation transporter [Halothermothrix orenii H 168]